VPGPETPADGGTPAPAPLDRVQALANTLGADCDTDVLRTREDATGWLRAVALLPPDAGLSNSEHGALLRLRESLRDVLAAHTDGHQDATAAERLSRALADGRIIVTVNPASAIRLASAARASYSGLVAIVAVAIADSAVAGTWLRLKSCSVAGCGVAFYDDSAAATATRCAAHAAGA
jgi:predicted RNA-binding Zn ribbon-like protein